MIEAWLLAPQAAVHGGSGSLHAEFEQRQDQKRRLYGKPEPTRQDVEVTALPLIRALQPNQIANLRAHSRSFAQFADQLELHRHRYSGPATVGNRATAQPSDDAPSAIRQGGS